ncbi:MAG: Uma2 family endonuclease [Caldilineaceae bacterium]|nr:Uma2 family endonuclease [Caldilineaceae bacterium]
MATAGLRESIRSVTNGRAPACPDPAWDQHRAPRHGDTDAVTARAAWKKRIAWRLAHPEDWRKMLEDLPYFDPAYTYDEAHEYEDDGTTDPHLSVDIRHWILDKDGFVSPQPYRHAPLLLAMLLVLRDILGNRVEREAEVHFDPDFGSRAGIYTEKGRPVSQVEPDLVVLPRELLLPDGAERSREGRTMRLDQGHPVPELVVEILSPSTRAKDLRGKMHLYADLGIAEYLTCDPGGEPEPDSPAELRFHRLRPGGGYQQEDDAPASPAYFSSVCDTQVRLWQPDTGRPPRFQWRDVREGRWRDPETDIEAERIQHNQERMDGAVTALRLFLGDVLSSSALDRIEAAWRRNGLPEGHLQAIRAVQQIPSEWRTLLPGGLEYDNDPDQPSLGVL